MTNFSESNFSDPSHGDEAGTVSERGSKPNWRWLQNRVGPAATAELGAWLDDQLVELELLFEGYVTNKSRSQATRRQFGDDRR